MKKIQTSVDQIEHPAGQILWWWSNSGLTELGKDVDSFWKVSFLFFVLFRVKVNNSFMQSVVLHAGIVEFSEGSHTTFDSKLSRSSDQNVISACCWLQMQRSTNFINLLTHSCGVEMASSPFAAHWCFRALGTTMTDKSFSIGEIVEFKIECSRLKQKQTFVIICEYISEQNVLYCDY